MGICLTYGDGDSREERMGSWTQGGGGWDKTARRGEGPNFSYSRNRWFSHYVTAAMLVHTNKRVLMNFFCYVHQNGRHGLFFNTKFINLK